MAKAEATAKAWGTNIVALHTVTRECQMKEASLKKWYDDKGAKRPRVC